MHSVLVCSLSVFSACDDYDSSNTDFIDECQNKIRAIALELETEKTPDKCEYV